MKKVSLIFILIAMAFLVVVPTFAFAATESVGSNLCLINPVAITVIDNKIFVADNVDQNNNQSVILCFDISASTPNYCFTHSVNKQIVNLSNVNGNLCVIYNDSFDLLEISESGLAVKQTYNEVGAVDVTYGKFSVFGQSIDTLYYIGGEQSQHLYYHNSTKFIMADSYDTLNAKACLEFGNYIYFLHGNGVCKRFNCSNGNLDADDYFNKSISYALGFVPRGMFTYDIGNGNQLAMYGDTGVYYMTYDAADNSHFAFENALLDYTNNSGKTIVDMSFGANKIFLLNSANQVEVYSYENNAFERLTNTIGTDTISLDIERPTQFTGFTLAKPVGYPTNIVYKTDWDNSIDELKKDFCDSVIVLDFDGADQLSYYYVLVGDKFGWIKKSDGENISVQNDSKMQIINNNVNQEVTYKAKFTTLNSVSVYSLPLSNSDRTTVSQDITNPQEVTVLQKYTETVGSDTVEWYYISYGDNQTGFVQSGNIGRFYSTGSVDNSGIEVIGYKKINSSIFEAVKLYLTSEMKDIEAIYDEQGDAVKLYSGARVVAVREEGNATFVEIRQNDGTTSYGWIATDNLIGLHAITTNAIVGLSILAAALLLVVVFWVLFIKRKRLKTEETTETADIK